jgi:hypothetical protein
MNQLDRRIAPFVSAAAAVVAALALAGCGEPPEDDSVAVDRSALTAPASAGRPASVPADYIVTPAGYFHPSCVQPLAAAVVAPCGLPHYDRSGAGLGDGAGTVRPRFSGGRWITNANAVVGGIGSSTALVVSADITVPKTPTYDGGQVLYMFDGLEPSSDGSEILQPVLGFNSGSWTMQNWNCCVDGNVFYDGAVTVKSGDSINQTVKGHVGSWDISWTRNGKPGKTFHVTGNNKTYDWLFAGVLEAYDITRCDEYPNDTSVAFRNLKVTSNGATIHPGWQADAPILSPNCATNTTIASTGVTIHYKSH